jgi:hypothetical protein
MLPLFYLNSIMPRKLAAECSLGLRFRLYKAGTFLLSSHLPVQFWHENSQELKGHMNIAIS